MDAINKEDLFNISEIKEVYSEDLHIDAFLKEVNDQIKEQLISNFGLSQLFDSFQDGGGVDTVHNVRKGIYSSDKVKSEIKKETTGYNKNISSELHSTKEYISINKEQTELKKQGKLLDPYTGKKIKKNEKTDLDHVISTKEIFSDPARVLSKKSTNELANNSDNLKLTNANINRSMKDISKDEYADRLSNNKNQWKNQLKKVHEDPNLTQEEKLKKERNIKNRLEADGERIKETYQDSRQKYEKKINQYYYSSDFLKANVRNGATQGARQAAKQVTGVILYQLINVTVTTAKYILKKWNIYNSMKERITEFISAFKKNIGDIKERISKIKSEIISGFSSGFLSAIFNTLINIVEDTNAKFAKILNDSISSLMQAAKILTKKDNSISFSEKSSQAIKVIATSLAASMGVIIGEAFAKVITTHAPILNPISSEIGDILSSVIIGIITGMLMYSILNFKQVAANVKKDFQYMMIGIKVSPETIRENYIKASSHVDALYQELLSNIYRNYENTHRLQELAYNMGISSEDQFYASIDLSSELEVQDNKILKNTDDVENYFKN